MHIYTVRHGDTPGSIAERLTGNAARMSELVAANPQKGLGAVRGLGAVATFENLYVGEKLHVPHSWSLHGLSGIPELSEVRGLGAAQGLGDTSANWVLTAASSIPSDTPSWNQFGAICGQAAWVVFRNTSMPDMPIYAQSGPSIKSPNAPIPFQSWYWTGAAPSDPSQLPAPPGVCPVVVVGGGGAVLAPGGGFNRTTPRGPLPPQHTM
jgi:hypothetical protein